MQFLKNCFIFLGVTRKSLPAKPVTTPRNSSTRTRTRNTESTHARTARVLEAMSVEKKLEKRLLRSKSAGINRLTTDQFTYSTEQQSSEQSSPEHSSKNMSEQPPSEFVLYKESKHYDNIIKSKTTPGHTGGKVRRESGESKKKPRISTSARTLTVPQTGGDEDGDDISEAGTYTIEVDKEVQSARQSIDQIFNVPSKLDTLRMVPRRPAVQKQTAVDNYSTSNTDTDINGNIEDGRDIDLVKPRGSVDDDSVGRDSGVKSENEVNNEVWHNAVETQDDVSTVIAKLCR